MIDHERARELAVAEIDFALSAEDREALQRHLDDCPACRALDEHLRADARTVADLPSYDAPEGLRARILGVAGTPGAMDAPADGSAHEHRPREAPRALSILPIRYRRPAAFVAAAAVIVALVGGTMFWRGSPVAGPESAVASPSGTAPAGPGQPGSTVDAGTWRPVADLTADVAQGGVVALSSGFRLASLDGTPAADLAARLTVEPPLAFAVAADADGRAARITPSEPLVAGAVYRFTLTAADGRTLDSWAFQAHQPLRVVETLPGDKASDIPTNTGIEVTFDQDGVVDAAAHVTIAPRVDGRFEQHGRTLAFVPAEPLKPATIYTVTVTRGITVGGTGEVLESDVRFAFETARPGTAKAATTFGFTDDVFELATADRPTIALWVFQEWDGQGKEPAPPKSAPVEVHRLRDLDGAIDAYRQLRSYPDWSRWATGEAVPTTDLPRAAAFDAKLSDSEGTMWFQLPARLPAGWYVVTLRSGTRASQTILQVTDIAAYLIVSETQTLVWANDLASGQPVAGATVAAAGVDLGLTDADGLRMEKTPAAFLASAGDPCANDCFPVVTVRSGERAAFLPANDRRQIEDGYYGSDQQVGGPAKRYWHAFDTDRTLYRRTDTVNAWGTVRDRVTGAVPGTVTIRLYAVNDEGAGGHGPALATAESHPNAIGAFSGSIALRDLPEGQYVVVARAGADVVGSRGIQIDRILKPAYRLEVTTGRRVYVQGDQVKVTATATFYEGSPVPGVPLRLEGLAEKTFTTDATGTATQRGKVGFDAQYVSGEPDVRSVSVSPARAEEGEISGASREIVVFPSSWTFDATAQIASGRVRVTGGLHAVDRDRLEREIAESGNVWELDAAGTPIAGKTVTATFTEFIPYRVKTGTRYDFIEKQVVPVYRVGYTERAAGTVRIKTKKDGTFAASIPASSAGHGYQVRLSATDPDKHAARWIGGASEPSAEVEQNPQPSLVLTSDPSSGGGVFGVGDPIDLTMADPGIPAHKTDRYLFTTAQAGLRDTRVQSSARYRATFDASAPPGIFISGVRFTGSGYTESPEFHAAFRQADRGISVGLTTNAARYEPGAEVTMTVTTRDRTGGPIPATVVLRAVDEKLFAMGGAEAADPLGELYTTLGSGIVATYRSHHEPAERPGGGDTTGGGGDESGGRQDFRDSILFRTVDTASDGRAVVTFRVADDLTSWRVSASAFAEGPAAGEATVAIPVGLPFFVDATIAPEYLVADRPSIGLRSFGTALPAGAPVTFAVASDSLGLRVDGLKAKAFETATVALPKLSLGNHKMTITATTGSGASARRDVMTRTISVVPSRLTQTRSDYVELTASGRLTGGDGLVEVVVSDAGAARFVPLVLGLTGTESARLERSLAAAIGRTLATDRFDLGDTVPPVEFDANTYQSAEDGGLAILPYASSDLEASALAALVAPQRFGVDRLEAYLSDMADNAKETRERRNVALAGLGGLHAAVLPRIRAAAADPGLTVRERLWLGLGAAALGDSATARSIGASLEAEHGEVTNEHARLRVGESAADITAGTAMMAMLAAANGDPLAPRFWAYVEANPGTEAPYELHAAGYVIRMLERAAPGAATFAYTIGDTREVVEIGTGDTFRMAVTDDQLASMTIEPVRGRIGVTTSWRETVKPSAFATDPDITISRRVTPSGTIGTAALVTVDLTVRLGATAPVGCHLVTDNVPSGLVPVGHLEGWVAPDDQGQAPEDVTFPYAQVGQRISFCADRTKDKAVVNLRYVARVVTAGTYAWEPAIVESRTATGRAALTAATVVTIR